MNKRGMFGLACLLGLLPLIAWADKGQLAATESPDPRMLVATQVGSAGNRSADREAILALIDAFVAGWDHCDAHGLSMLWSADGDFTVPDGSLLKGQKEIEAFYTGVFATRYEGSKATATIDQLRFLGADFAVLDGQIEITGVQLANHQVSPPEKGCFTVIVQRVSRGWQIIANREMEPPLGEQTRFRTGDDEQLASGAIGIGSDRARGASASVGHGISGSQS